MFLVDFEQGRLIPDEELKLSVASKRPYKEWLESQRIRLSELPKADAPPRYEEDAAQADAGVRYTTESLQFMLIR